MNQKGQSLLEMMIALPVFIVLISGLALLFARGALLIELQTLTQELKVCYASTHPKFRCQSRYRRSLSALPGGWRLLQVQNTYEFSVQLTHQLPLPPRVWKIKVQR